MLEVELQLDLRDAAPSAERRVTEDGGIGVGGRCQGSADWNRSRRTIVLVAVVQGDVVRLNRAGECRVGMVDKVERCKTEKNVLAVADAEILLRRQIRVSVGRADGRQS